MLKYVDMLRDIYKYECLTRTDETERTVEYVPEINMYKTELTNAAVKQKYFKIKNKLSEIENNEIPLVNNEVLEITENIPEKKNDEIIVPEPAAQQVQVLKELSIKDSKIFVEKIRNNATDTAFFSYQNIKNALHNYMNIKSDKAIGYIYQGESYYILKKQEHNEYSKATDRQNNALDYFQGYYEELIVEQIKKMEEEEILRKKEKEEASKRAEELHINPEFKKRFYKILKKDNLKCIVNQDFTAFDFRQINLNNIFFFNCVFDHADFTDLEIVNAVFVECSFIHTKEEGATFDSCRRIKCITNI